MGELTFFEFEGYRLRTVQRDGEPWFVTKDVCAILGLGDQTSQRKLADDEKGVETFQTLGGEQELSVVSESGFYVLVLRCQRALTEGTIAYRFRRWVTGVVLPTLRKTGIYVVPGAEHQSAVPVVEDERQLMVSLAVVREARQIFGRKKAERVWAALGLPDVDGLPPARATRTLADGAPVTVRQWKENCTRPVEGWCRSSELWRSYQNFCAAQEFEPINQTAFGLALNGLGHVSKKNGNVERYGLTVV